MKKLLYLRIGALLLLSVLASLPATSFALNPVIQTMYTADPAPMVHDGTLYLFSSHDEDVGEAGNFNMKDWVLSTTTDMVNWTQHGAVATLHDFKWAGSGWGGGFENGAWALQCIEREGKWYMYCPLQGRGIGVLVADNPFGPFTDPIGKPLIGGQYDSIDPTVYIDDKGQAYLYWGNPNLWSVKLNKDMISYDTSVGENGIMGHPMTVKALGERIPPDEKRGTSYEEGPWLYKRNNLYYLFFAAGPIPEHLGYSTGPTAEGPWTYGGVIMAPPERSFTIHPGVVDYKGKTYLFYHNGALPGGDGFKRSVCVDELKFNPDGSVPMVQPTHEGPAPVATLDPYKRVEAETIAWSSGVKIEPSSAGGQAVREIHDGDHIRVRNVDFGATGARAFMASLFSTAKAKEATGAKIEIRLGKLDGQLIGTLPVSGTGGEWKPQYARISGPSGVHDLIFVFRGAAGEDLFKFDYWQFSQRDLPAELATLASPAVPAAQAAPAEPAHNPLIWADVPDICVIRVGKTYYMSSTTMHMSPGLPIMKSEDLVNWRMASYAHENLVDNEDMRLENGKSAYSKGSWASSLRYHDGVFYAATFAYTSGRTHIYSTRDPDRGPWKETSFEPAMHDNSLFFDDDGRVYMVYGGGRIRLTELLPDLSGIKPGGVDKVLIENVNTVFGTDLGGLNGEGSQLFKIKGRYYLVNIASPGSRWARSVIVNRADTITGPYEARIVLDDRGIAQGGLVDTPEGKWYAYLFKDNDSVGRIPYLVPVTWKDGWPVLGEDGKAPMTLDIPAGGQGASGASGIVASDEFSRRPGDPSLPLAWQWNHNPDNKLWSVTQRPGFMRLTTGRVDADLPSARNTLTQRTFGPNSSATTSIDVSGMKDGDYAGIAAFQRRYGFVGVKMSGGARSIVMVSADSETPEEIASVPLTGKTVHLKVECEFSPAPEFARFSYSLDGKSWTPIGRPSALKYTVPHFMGYRFALFYYSTQTAGGRVDFDYYRIGEGGGSISANAPAPRASLPPLAPRNWTTTGPLVYPTADTNHPIVAVKDPSVVFHDGRWHIFATTAGSNGWGMAHFSFSDWDKAKEAKPFYLDENPNLAGYNCAPQAFYFRPQKKWYMIFQSQQPRFSTTDNIEDPMSWSAPQNFFEGTPKSVVEGWLDYWIICDDTHAYLFFPDDHGRMYRSRTTLADFPRGFDEPVVILHEAKNDLFEGSCVYRIKGTNQFLLLVECIGKHGPRYYRAWVSDCLDGEWKPLPGADTEETPFAGDANVRTSDGSPRWAEGVSHGELLREGNDETMTVDPQNLRFLYQGLPVGSKEPDYLLLPYRLALLKPSTALVASLTSAADTVGDPLPPLPHIPAIPAAQPMDSVPMADSRSAPEVKLDLPITPGPYAPTWESIEKNYPGTPAWLREAKFGIWVHFGPQAAGKSGDWYARNLYIPDSGPYKNHLANFGHPSEVGYKEVLRDWNPTKLDPAKLVKIYKDAGARYLIIQGVHHDQYDMWNSKYQPWNSTRLGPKRDLLGEWTKAARADGIRFGVTFHHEYSWWWWQTAFGADGPNGPKPGVPYDGHLTLADGEGKWWEGLDPRLLYGIDLREYKGVSAAANKGWSPPADGIFQNHAAYAKWYATWWALRMMDVVDKYQPDFIYTDGFSSQPFSGWGTGTGHKSDAMQRVIADFYNKTLQRRGKVDVFSIVKFRHKTNGTVNTAEADIPEHIKSDQDWIAETPVGDWFYAPGFVTDSGMVIRNLLEEVSRDGNIAVNICPLPDGSLDDGTVKMLKEIGEWTRINGAGIYGSKAWTRLGEGADGKLNVLPGGKLGRKQAEHVFTASDIRFTVGKDDNLYAYCMTVPATGTQVRITSLGSTANALGKPIKSVTLLGYTGTLTWKHEADALVVTLPDTSAFKTALGFKIETN